MHLFLVNILIRSGAFGKEYYPEREGWVLLISILNGVFIPFLSGIIATAHVTPV